jgi:hypothetical protein
MSTLEEALKQDKKHLEVMGLFEGVSKLVSLWHISKHGPHRKTLIRILQEALVVKKISYNVWSRSHENMVKNPRGVVMDPRVN